jgi:fucose permease
VTSERRGVIVLSAICAVFALAVLAAATSPALGYHLAAALIAAAGIELVKEYFK